MSESSASHPPSSSHRDSYQPVSAYNENTSISQLAPEYEEHVFGAELQKLLAHLTVVSPYQLLSATFPDKTEWDKTPNARIKFAFEKRLRHRKLKFSEKDPALYQELADAFNTCCANVALAAPSNDYAPEKKLACIDIHAKRPKAEDLTGDLTRRTPDLCLTFDTLDNYSADKFFSGAVVAIEFKSDVNADPGFIARNAPGTVTSKQGRWVQAPTNAASKLLLQAFNYVSSQWAELPYRFVWSITIARDILRIWRWSASGVVVTEAIDYIEDATPVYQFLQAIGKGPYSRLGLDIGHGMAFRGVERKMGAQVKQIVDCYLNAATKTEFQVKWSTKALQGTIWRFEQASSIPVSTRVNLIETHQSPENEDSAIDMSRLYVLSHPIWRGKGVYSRGTRCYLAVSQSTLDRQKEITVQDLRMLKTSWQTAGDSRESEFFSYVQAAHDGHVPHLTTMLAAGSLEFNIQNGGTFFVTIPAQGRAESEESASPGPISRTPHSDDSAFSDEPDEEDEFMRRQNIEKHSPELVAHPEGHQLQWIVFKQVGERISGFRGEKELLQVILDAIQAHEHLYTAGILHGDVSENNVLIELGSNQESGSTRRGLLIDLDIARFISPNQASLAGSNHEETQNARRPEVTGTLLFMSAAMSAVPFRHCWHDLESFYWLLLFITLRHVQGLKLYMPGPDELPLDLDSSENRNFILSEIFPVSSDGRNVLATFSKAKKEFINEEYTLTSPSIPFAEVMARLKDKLKSQYNLMRKMQDHVKFLEESTKALKLTPMNLPFRVVFTAHTAQDLVGQIPPMMEARDAIKTAFEKLEHSKRTLAENILPFGSDPASLSQEATQDLEEAREFIKSKGLDQLQHWRLSTRLPRVTREMETLERQFHELRGFPNHLYFKQTLEAAIKVQSAFPSLPAAPYQSKKRPLASNNLREILGFVRSGSGEASHTPAAPGVSSGASGGISSDRAKRKRSEDISDSDNQGKRQKKSYRKKGSSQATQLHNLIGSSPSHDDGLA